MCETAERIVHKALAQTVGAAMLRTMVATARMIVVETATTTVFQKTLCPILTTV
jgi:hypothetical protein